MLRRCARDLTDASCYEPVVESFHNQRNLRREKVVEQRRRFHELYPAVYKYEIGNLRLESLDSRRAVVTFDREWDIAGERRYAGAARERVALAHMSGSWKIIREDEQQVYWIKRR
jgi:hypothetical protein